jgi:DNA-binding CsgD family transcriptional regulator
VHDARGVGPELLGRRPETDALDRLVADARAGRSGVLVVRGEAGVGKTALLDRLAATASDCRVARAAGVESEMELAYAGLHQLCAPYLDRVAQLPAPQASALGAAFGLSAGETPDRFLVGLAVLNLLAAAADDQPLLCLVDDAQWLDRVSAQTLAFVARRLAAEPIAVVFGLREPTEDQELAGFDELALHGLGEAEARTLLDSVVPGPMDERVRDRIVAESRGNPLALLELPRSWTEAELADGLGAPDTTSMARRIEECYVRRLERLSDDARRVLLLAAAEPLGDPALFWTAAGQLGLGVDPAGAAVASGLVDIGSRVRFHHPLVRSAVYRSAPADQRQQVHGALAEATDPAADPDRRAWHRAQALTGPDEDVAADLEVSAARAQTRGGISAAAEFLAAAAVRTPDPDRRAQRGLAAASARRDAGAFEAALGLLGAVDAGPADPRRAAEVAHLRGQIAFDQRHVRDAAPLLLDAARRLEPLDPGIARETHLEALAAAIWATGPGLPDVITDAARAARLAPPAADPPRPSDLVLDALALRLTDGYVAAAPALIHALGVVRAMEVGPGDVGRWLWLAGNRASGGIALDVWDLDASEALALRQDELARHAGALVQLQFALNFRANNALFAGDLAGAERLIDEDRQISAATGNPPVAYGALLFEAFRGHEDHASTLIREAEQEAGSTGQGRLLCYTAYARAVLGNGLGRYDEARDAARRVLSDDVVGWATVAAGELAEAASRTGDAELLEEVLTWLGERAQVTPTDWALGMEARVRALLRESDEADALHRESVERLERARLRAEAARGRLLHGEWLRREGRRVDAREQLTAAHEQLSAMGLEAFAERAAHELQATGATVRKRTPETQDDLTPQEVQIAQLARDGHTNPEIAARLFISPRTVEWHLRKTFAKLGIASRKELRGALTV